MTESPNESRNLDSSKGGKARAEKLSPDERKAIAQKAAKARWGNRSGSEVANATHMGTLELGSLHLPCAVLEDGRRVISERGLMEALGIQRSGTLSAERKDEDGTNILPLYLAPRQLRPFIDMELAQVLSTPLFYVGKNAKSSEYEALGVSADLIPKICDVWLKARDANVLTASQLKWAANADIIMRGLAHVGILALVDEATGYQKDRARDALAKILEQFIERELRPYAKTFPLEYYQELFRLRDLDFDGTLKKPQPRYIGQLTNNIVYARLAPGVLDELKRINPATNGQRKHKHFQWLTENIGYPRLMQHLAAVIVLMKVSKDYDSFMKMLDTALPKQIKYPLFDTEDDHLTR